MDKYEGAVVMVMALRICQEYMLEHKGNRLYRVDCSCRTCKKVRELYERIGGNDDLFILMKKYFGGNDG